MLFNCNKSATKLPEIGVLPAVRRAAGLARMRTGAQVERSGTSLHQCLELQMHRGRTGVRGRVAIMDLSQTVSEALAVGSRLALLLRRRDLERVELIEDRLRGLGIEGELFQQTVRQKA